MFSFSHPPARFIPAYTGNSALACSRRARRSVHPRLRGELILVLRPALIHIGSSPLTRGTLCMKVIHPDHSRFIPAYAGNSLWVSVPMLLVSVHPRLRGELMFLKLLSKNEYGSSPLTRGTLRVNAFVRMNTRFIPAYAGNSLGDSAHGFNKSVHPRLRGELEITMNKGPHYVGSSPLTRGTHFSPISGLI